MNGVIITKPGQAVVEKMDVPAIKDDEVLIRVEVAGLCGSDLHIFKGVHITRKPPVMPGHEVSGEVIAIGKSITRIKEGDRVTVEPNNYCGHCFACKNGNQNLCSNKIVPGLGGWEGTFAQYFAAPEKCVYKIKPETTYEQAVLAEPLAVAVHAVKRAGSGKRMIIIGCGTIGLLILKIALLKGYKEVYCTDTIAYNHQIALDMGAMAVWNPLSENIDANVKDVSDGLGMDAVMITASASGILDQALSVSAMHANVILIAMMNEPQQMNMVPFNGKEINYTGTNTYTPEDFNEALKYLEEGLDLSPIVTHHIPMSQVQHAFELYENRKEDVIKIFIYPNE